MSYSIRFSKRAERKFESMPEAVQLQLKPIITALADNPRPVGIKAVKELNKCYRLRLGDYRIIYTIRDSVLLVLVLSVVDRKEAYSQKELSAIRSEIRHWFKGQR